MSDQERIKRYTLVKRSTPGEDGVRHYSLARIGVSRRSALGQDRHERLEQIADLERAVEPEGESEAQRRNGGDPA